MGLFRWIDNSYSLENVKIEFRQLIGLSRYNQIIHFRFLTFFRKFGIKRKNILYIVAFRI